MRADLASGGESSFTVLNQGTPYSDNRTFTVDFAAVPHVISFCVQGVSSLAQPAGPACTQTGSDPATNPCAEFVTVEPFHGDAVHAYWATGLTQLTRTLLATRAEVSARVTLHFPRHSCL